MSRLGTARRIGAIGRGLKRSAQYLASLLRDRSFGSPVFLSVALGVAFALAVLSFVRVEEFVPPLVEAVLPLDTLPDPGFLVLPFISWTGMPADLQRADLDALLAIALALAVLGLAVACVSVAVLLLGRASARRHGLAVRRALGATRRRLIPPFAFRAAAAAGVGALAGAMLGSALAAGLHLIWPYFAGDPFTTGSFDLLIAVAVPVGVAVTAAACALALVARYSDLRAMFAAGARATAGTRETELRRALVALQFAAVLALLTGAGLLARNAAPLRGTAASAAPPDSVLTFRLELASNAEGDAAHRAARLNSLLAAAARIPGVEAESLSSAGAWAGIGATANLLAECRCVLGNAYLPYIGATARHFAVSPDFFSTLGIRLLRGRGFTHADGVGAARAAIVNRAFVDNVFRHTVQPDSILGRELWLGGATGPIYRIIGVAETVHARALGAGREAAPAVYLSAFQHPPAALGLALTIEGDPEGISAAVRGAVKRILPAAKLGHDSMLRSRRAALLAPAIWFGWLFAALAFATLLIAAYGLFAAVRGGVERRSREIGIRMALGAPSRRVVGAILLDSGRLVAFGIGVGSLAAFATARALQLRFYGIRLFDPVLLGCIAAALAVVAFLAAIPPARKAARTDPAVTLREV